MNVSADLVELLSSPKKIIITAHQKPDGDALGSSLALYGILKKMNHQIEVIYPSDFPSYYRWMPFVDICKIYKKTLHHHLIIEADLIFYLDFNSIDRIEDMKISCNESNAVKVMIDHHLYPTDMAKYIYSNTFASSTAEMIYKFIESIAQTHLIDKDIASCIYTGIVTDTGGFQFSCTRAGTHLVASHLISLGIDIEYIYNNCYNNFSIDRLKLFGYCLSEKMVILNDKVAYISLTELEKTKFKIQEGDTEGLVNFPLKIEGIEIVALFKQDYDKIKISFRSKGTNDVNAIANKYFNGGGHRNAAGGFSFKSLEDTIKLFEQCFNQNLIL